MYVVLFPPGCIVSSGGIFLGAIDGKETVPSVGFVYFPDMSTSFDCFITARK